jgi:hypothetical protein
VLTVSVSVAAYPGLDDASGTGRMILCFTSALWTFRERESEPVMPTMKKKLSRRDGAGISACAGDRSTSFFESFAIFGIILVVKRLKENFRPGAAMVVEFGGCSFGACDIY